MTQDAVAAIDIETRERATIARLLRRHLPGVNVWAYGSRVRWNARPQSDLDLVAFASPEQRSAVLQLREAFEKSPLPFSVDLLIWDDLPESFHGNIKSEYVVMQLAGERSTDNKWPVVPVSEVATAIIGGTPSRKVAEFWNGNIPWATARDVAAVQARRLYQAQERITKQGLESSAAKLMPEGTVIITSRGTVGALAQLGEEMAFNQTCYALLPNHRLDNLFLYYALSATLEEMRGLTYGTVFETITRRTFENWEIPLPPLPEQRAIAHVLGSLDDKIELNRRMNETLEEMARALFKSWFVDFDPVRAKMEGRWRRGESLPGLPADLYDLFPGRLADSELGQIPEGWEVKMLGDVIELAYGKALKAGDRKGGDIPVYGSNGQVGWHDEKLVDGPGIVVGRKGNPGIVTWSHTDFFPIDTAFYIVPQGSDLSLLFLFFALTYQGLPSVSADSAVPGLNRNLAYMNKQNIPDRTIIDAFSFHAASIFARRHCLEEESRALAAQRDALLPGLVSGQVRVQDSHNG